MKAFDKQLQEQEKKVVKEYESADEDENLFRYEPFVDPKLIKEAKKCIYGGGLTEKK